MDLTTTNAKLADLDAGAQALLQKEDLDVLFSMRVSGLITVCEPKLKTYMRTREKLDRDYLVIPIKSKDGQTIGFRTEEDKRHEYTEKRQKLDDEEVTIEGISTFKLSEFRKMSEEEDIPIEGTILHALRPVIIFDVSEDARPKAAEKKTRAARRKRARDAAKEASA